MSEEKSLPPGVMVQTAVKDWLLTSGMSPGSSQGLCNMCCHGSHGALGEQKEPSLQLSSEQLPQATMGNTGDVGCRKRATPAFSVAAFKQDVRHRSHKLYLFPFKA